MAEESKSAPSNPMIGHKYKRMKCPKCGQMVAAPQMARHMQYKHPEVLASPGKLLNPTKKPVVHVELQVPKVRITGKSNTVELIDFDTEELKSLLDHVLK